MKAIKHSKQRDSIKTCLMGRRDHPTADAVYMSIREEFPNISLGTVYRNLNLLVDLGEIQKLTWRQWAGPVRRRYQPTLPFCMQTLRRRV